MPTFRRLLACGHMKRIGAQKQYLRDAGVLFCRECDSFRDVMQKVAPRADNAPVRAASE